MVSARSKLQNWDHWKDFKTKHKCSHAFLDPQSAPDMIVNSSSGIPRINKSNPVYMAIEQHCIRGDDDISYSQYNKDMVNDNGELLSDKNGRVVEYLQQLDTGEKKDVKFLKDEISRAKTGAGGGTAYYYLKCVQAVGRRVSHVSFEHIFDYDEENLEMEGERDDEDGDMLLLTEQKKDDIINEISSNGF